MTNEIINKIDFSKSPDGLVPAVVQDNLTLHVLMLGYMNIEAVSKTIETKKVTFYSRSKKRLWTKGEESKHFLELVDILLDCDSDALLVKATPKGPTCHLGNDTCWDERNIGEYAFLSELEQIISDRIKTNPENSYVASLNQKGNSKIVQKLGEEAIETVIAALSESNERLTNEAADLIFHLIIVLKKRGLSIGEVLENLIKRNRNK